jgi:hypothetical protein
MAELMIGNVHIIYAAAIVAGFRWPAAWAFLLLTKVTPGIGLLWFLVRREWRALGIALGATAAVALVSFAVAPELWWQWAGILLRGEGPIAPAPSVILVPLAVRLPIAAAIVAWGAWTDRRWAVPLAVTLALPVLWTAGLSILVAIVALRSPRKANREAGDVFDQLTTWKKEFFPRAG